ncbi:putative F-box protein At3g16210 [Vigna radiata var. radiata]|uniref:F-box protein At3g16210 n=1 Tax=Vigna radiata var. radiata TaxID=3916 RepID=A0A1S3ULA6_VIGRR|nr:putative F-box protein At3g16210 [Vigna radiata var. radiata]
MKKQSERKGMELLPENMIMEILFKLNVKSLVRCKSVCKSWLSLISDSHFKKLHFDRSVATEKFMFLSDRKLTTIDFNASLNYDSSCVHFKVPHGIFDPINFTIGGSCRGFLVLESGNDKCLWNPCTGFYKQVCGSPFEYSLETTYNLLFEGLGYDPLTDDYLVVELFSKLYCIGGKYAQVFSIRANKWKEIQPINLSFSPCDSENYRSGRVLNNAIHWLGCCFKEEMDVFLIFGFDVTKRMFFEIAGPVDVAPINLANSMDRKSLTEVAGLLSLY